MIGTRLAHYEITSHLGTGGMGEVYQASDSKLGRSVAIKFLPEAFSHDNERVARFQREARVLASLNHPHIAGIYDLQETNGYRYLVLELVEGETLAERIARGPIPIEDALKIARSICEALEAAHEKGIMHRDLKPANIKITPDGKVKVLDFGLAKVFVDSVEDVNLSQSPTMTGSSMPGIILGTAAYMSPEQAKGRTVDKRTDIFAFGCVLYEMLTGQPLFAGESVSDTVAAVLTKEPEWDRTPLETRRLLQSCLERDPKRRLRDIGDAWKLLDGAPNLSERRGTNVWVLAACLFLLAAIAASWGWWRAMQLREPLLRPLVRLDLDLGPDISVETTGATAILSPDETRLVFVSADSAGVPTLFTRLLDQPKAMQLPGTEGANSPFFSPDGEWIGFFSRGKLKKTRVTGGDPIPLCDAPAGRGGAWSADGTIIAVLDTRTGLSRIAPDGTVSPLTTLEAGEATHRWPRALPENKGVIFTVSNWTNNYGEASIAVVSAATGWKKKILLSKAGMSPHYVSTGHLVYVTNTTVYAVPFDLDRLEVNGSPSPVLEGVSVDTFYGLAQLDFSRNGTILYRQVPSSAGRNTLQWLDRTGKTEMAWPEAAPYLIPRVAPDGSSRLAVVITQTSTSDIWVYDWERGNRTKLNDGSPADSYPVWSPNGQYLFFQSANGIFWARADGTEREPFTKSIILQTPTSFSGNGKVLAFFERSPGGGALIKTVNVDYATGRPTAGQPQIFLQTPSSNPYPALSPDGSWLAYGSTEDGPYQVYVRAYPSNGKKWPISTSGGQTPVWSRTTRELFYRSDDGRIMVVTYSAKDGDFVASKPQPFATRRFRNSGVTPNFDLAPDSRRFAVLMPDAAELESTRSHVTLVLNFFDEMHRRLTGSKK